MFVRAGVRKRHDSLYISKTALLLPLIVLRCFFLCSLQETFRAIYMLTLNFPSCSEAQLFKYCATVLQSSVSCSQVRTEAMWSFASKLLPSSCITKNTFAFVQLRASSSAERSKFCETGAKIGVRQSELYLEINHAVDLKTTVSIPLNVDTYEIRKRPV